MTFTDVLAQIKNRKHRRFVQEYLVDLDGTNAAIRAGFKSGGASTRAWHLLRRPEISLAVSLGQQEMSERVEVRQSEVLQGYLNCAFYDPANFFEENGNLKKIHDIPQAARMAISGIDVMEVGNGEKGAVAVIKKLRFWDRLKAMDALGRHLGLFNADESQKPEITFRVVDDRTYSKSSEG